MSNLEIWNALGKTDPAQTKAFKRGGGFTGTAIKPVYTEQKMTDQFGPCGIGWGFSEPTFQVLPGENKEVLVYCWLTLWYVRDGKQSGPIPGVGGDKAVVHIKANDQYNRPERWENDDEAFKKAFTDAVGNAMKHLGMSADVHMGLFDDSKYVNERRNEEAQERASSRPKPAAPSTPFDEPEDRTIIDTMLFAMKQATTRADLKSWGAKQAAEIEALPGGQPDEMRAAYAAFFLTLPVVQKEAA